MPKQNLEILTDIDMLLKFEKEIGSGICHSINRYVKVNIKYIEDYEKK